MLAFDRLSDFYSSLVPFLLFSFIGFSLFAWGLFGESYGLSAFGLVIILVSLFVVRKRVPKHILLGGILGATFGTGLAIPVGLLIGQYLTLIFGYLAAAVWGVILSLVLASALVTAFSEYLWDLPTRIQNRIYGLAMVAGIYFGVAIIGPGMGKAYGPIGGSMLIGWTFGMVLGLIAGYRRFSDNDESYPPTDLS